jgi:ubiquinone/menaquinone biosynthesis C-methylase UbiE
MIKHFIAKQFRQPSGFFGSIVGRLMSNGNLPAIVETIQRLGIEDTDTILEIGYGPGRGIQEILTKNAYCTMKGIDFSDLMYTVATKRNRKFINNNRLELLKGDFLSFGLPENAFSKVFGVNVIYFWPDLVLAATKIKKILKPGGKTVFYMSHKDDLVKIGFTKSSIFSKHDIEKVLGAFKQAGFSKVSSGEGTIGQFRCFYITATN